MLERGDAPGEVWGLGGEYLKSGENIDRLGEHQDLAKLQSR